jgi:hypothetical protein
MTENAAGGNGLCRPWLQSGRFGGDCPARLRCPVLQTLTPTRRCCAPRSGAARPVDCPARLAAFCQRHGRVPAARGRNAPVAACVNCKFWRRNSDGGGATSQRTAFARSRFDRVRRAHGQSAGIGSAPSARASCGVLSCSRWRRSRRSLSCRGRSQGSGGGDCWAPIPVKYRTFSLNANS